jgi:hypothetical protein
LDEFSASRRISESALLKSRTRLRPEGALWATSSSVWGPHPIVRTSELEESQVPTMTEERIAGLTRVQRSRERETNRPEESSKPED